MKSVVLFSGGLDSTALLSQRLFIGEKVYPINFYYGSKHNAVERKAAEAICKTFNLKLKEVNLDFVAEEFKSDLLQTGGDIPEGHYAAETMKATVVPFRNGIMLSIAAGYAESIGAEQVCIANHAGDHFVYLDCREEFIFAMRRAIELGTGKISLQAPFTTLTKSDIVTLGSKYSAPFALSWSCYKGGDVHCGRCSTCIERREAFYLAKVSDPTLYKVSLEESFNIGGIKF